MLKKWVSIKIKGRSIDARLGVSFGLRTSMVAYVTPAFVNITRVPFVGLWVPVMRDSTWHLLESNGHTLHPSFAPCSFAPLDCDQEDFFLFFSTLINLFFCKFVC